MPTRGSSDSPSAATEVQPSSVKRTIDASFTSLGAHTHFRLKTELHFTVTDLGPELIRVPR
ncbi:hypothetical protein CH306_03920 [Rhodococcus sp. 15-725-2-2b]|nr:hypothetical protein CH277_02195 [Rhodococcus sp. 06-469-3-2]OZD43815.1 hypothetical protein CH264_16695 [Rhodococcus sp. 06-1477-1A]OZE77792.1 hypothetical protein CH306_03920 [Rhodococcus sp. 15-725-2-2b]OZF38825.1 hypothetical protein CH296_03865 [Rhodococcus sp. 14-2496-1d]